MSLPLRDIHVPPAPPAWPPAPGWWIVAAIVLAVAAGVVAWRLRRRWRRRRIEALFDTTVARAATPPEAIAAMSELLRRAARERDPAAAHLHGDAWLEWLRGWLPPPAGDAFAADAPAARALLEGGYRADAGDDDAAAVRAIARPAWLTLMLGTRR